MRCAADFRAEARAALKGRWGLAIGIGFLAMVLGGFTSMGLPEITLRFEGGDLQIALEALGQTLHPLDMIAGGTLLVGLGVIIVLGWLVRMLIGMIVTVGYMKFNMDLIDGEIGGVEMLFRYFQQWRTMLAAGLLQAVYIIGWTLLFGFGSGATMILGLTFIGLRASSAHQAAALSGMAQSVGYLLAACGPPLMGRIHDANGDWHIPLLAVALISLVMAVCGALAGRDREIHP